MASLSLAGHSTLAAESRCKASAAQGGLIMDDTQYHERRASQERKRASAATQSMVAQIRLELADRHAYMAWSIRDRFE